jgi:hypothetical protein
MILFKRIEIDLSGEPKRIKRYSLKRQREALFKLLALFEQGKWQECLNHVRDEKAFPYNERGEYTEREHINGDMVNVLRDLAESNYYTGEQLLQEARTKEAREKLMQGKLTDDGHLFYCWHKKPFGSGPYCGSCGGLIKSLAFL